ncbi:hypothetical protein DIPPA_27782 [Diplonema papillatum]|nr:hypothetical protein DIPPA_27782 [Diplonema papillatum]
MARTKGGDPLGALRADANGETRVPVPAHRPGLAWLRYWDERTFLAAIDWLSGLEWSSNGDMAAVEAAIDFMLFSGLDIKAPSKAAKTHREKANGIRCMLSAINKLAVQQQLGLPGDFKSRTTALSFISLRLRSTLDSMVIGLLIIVDRVESV